ncbi:hypothetical protein [Geomonas agri]|uniref:hypothetical protein n=1 Tax=Geomonas agri TaxID=2873702 RepID=UPI001CD71F14|nr:hypothetical protein [Geomonas agri]
MTRVLLIADTQRVQRIFHQMSEQGLLHLQTASTLALGEFELSSFSPDVTFVQSRISGFSGDILLRHLDKLLPAQGRLVLLAGDSEDAAQARRHGRISLDLTMDDALLGQSVAALLAGEPLPAAPIAEEEQPAKAAPPKARKGAAAPPAQLEHSAQFEQSAQPERPTAEPAPVASVPFQPLPQEAPAAGGYPPPKQGAKSAISAFEDVMQQAEARTVPVEEALPEVEDRVEVRTGTPRRELVEETLPAPPALDEAAKGGGGYYTGETVAEALRRAEQKKPRRLLLYIVPVLIVVAIPLVAYLAGKSSAPEQGAIPVAKPTAKQAVKQAPSAAPAQVAPASPAVPAGSVPAVSQSSAPTPQRAPGATPAPSQGVPSAAVPAPKAPAAAPTPSAKPQTPAGAKPGQAKTVVPRGVERLPAMLEGTKPDPEYGKKHPGWVRYLGIRAEYKLFQENNVYRAIQVIPVPGGTISDDLLQRVLRQFGGADSYRVESTAAKGEYLVEQCATSGAAAVTIYRNKTNKKVKALVVYYP